MAFSHLNLSNSPSTESTNSQEKWHIEHGGHENMHSQMMAIIVLVMVTAQVILFLWRRTAIKSYQLCTTVAMWILPFCISLYRNHLRFVIIHAIYSIITLYMLGLTIQKPLKPNTPRTVYTWFVMIYKLAYKIGSVGYFGLLFWFFGLNVLLGFPFIWITYFVLALFYGLYFAVLNRDIAEICVNQLLVNSKSRKIFKVVTNNDKSFNVNRNNCNICGQKIVETVIIHNSDAGRKYCNESTIEKSVRLECGHIFHEFCIRGWCLIGKKEICPECQEKVELQILFPNPWEKIAIMYSKLLDFLRYLIAWQPILTLLIEAFNHMLHLE